MPIAEELEVGLGQLRTEAAPPALTRYALSDDRDQATGGATSIRDCRLPLRAAGSELSRCAA